MLQSNDKPERVTVERVVSKIGQRGLLEKHLDKLQNLYSVVESDSEYQKRRILWAVHKLESTGEELKEWRISRWEELEKMC